MRVALICAVPPRADGNGPAWRAAWLAAALSEHHEVDVHVARAARATRVLGALRDAVAGRPAQVGWSMPPSAWRRVTAATESADVAVVVTVRAIRGPLTMPLVIDHIDALSLNMQRRSNGPENPLVRAVAARESRRLRDWEQVVASWATVQLVIDERDRAQLAEPPPVVVVGPTALSTTTAALAERDIDVILTGNMHYPPNREAARWLDEDIVPAIRDQSPGARVVVAGRSAARLRLRHAEAMSDVPSVVALLARARVAIVPLRGLGTGAPIKVLEAAACGAALVMTPWAHERLPLPARVADDASGLAAAVVALLEDEDERQALAAASTVAVRALGVERLVKELDAVLATATSALADAPRAARVWPQP